MRPLLGTLAVLFAAAALLQFNDPDAPRWLALYIGAAVICGVSTFRPLPTWVPVAFGVVALAWAALLVPSVVREASFTGTEIERELAGLLIVAAAMAIARSRSRRGRYDRPATRAEETTR